MLSSSLHHFREDLEPRVMGAFGTTFEKASWAQCRLIGAWLGLGLYGALGRRRFVAINNVRLAFPHLNEAQANQIARRAVMNFGMTFAEFMHMRSASPEEVRKQCLPTGLEEIYRGLDRGKGVILSTAHLGNWEVMGAGAAQNFPLSVVARPTSNSGVQAQIDAARAAVGIRVISKYDTGRASLKVLRDNGTLGILPDQHAGALGLLLPMFGQPTRFIPAVPKLAMMSGATVVPAYGVRRRPWLADGRIEPLTLPGWTVENTRDEVEKEARIREGTLRVIHDLETAIKAHPDQWLWLHRRWRKADGAQFPL